MRDLFRGYNKLIRPVQNMTQKVEVAFGLAFIQLINVVSIIRGVAGWTFSGFGSSRVGFECSGNGSGRVFRKASFRVSGFAVRVSGNNSGNQLVLRSH